jgi:hypothetical protein
VKNCVCLFSPCGIHPEGFFLKEKIKMRGYVTLTQPLRSAELMAKPVEGEEFNHGFFSFPSRRIRMTI